MRERPRDLDDTVLRPVLAEHWDVDAADLRYEPVGYGSHHWSVTTTEGGRHFVTVDVLPGRGGQQRLEQLRAAMRTAVALRRQGGLEFVVAPAPAVDGEVVVRVGQFAVTLLPFVQGRPWSTASGADAAALLDMLGRLHGATPAARPYARSDDLRVEARRDLQDALSRLDERWDAGPYSAGCRDLLAAAAGDVRDRLASYDALVAGTRRRAEPVVPTHGEPKPDNLLHTASGPALVDWDTALLAPAARDLWWLAAHDPGAVDRYAAATGRSVHPDDLVLYRLRWDLTDLALFVRDLRGPHARDGDTDIAWRAVQHLLQPDRPHG